MGAATSNHYVTALRGFGSWITKSAKATDSNPFESLEKVDARSDVRKSRRVLNRKDFGKLVEASSSSSWKFRGLTGKDRAMIYVVASYTGLRAGEIASLSPSSFDLSNSPPVMIVSPAYTKNNELARIPLRSDLVAQLATYLKGKEKTDCVWPGTWAEAGAKMIRRDLQVAGINFTDAHGDDYDFHALRHQFITDLSKAGVSLRAAQELARHSKPELTANIYTHLSAQDTIADVEKLAAIPPTRISCPAGSPQETFGPVPRPVRNKKQANLGNKQEPAEKWPEGEKSPVFTGNTGLSPSDADGTRTRNLRIDSPGL